MQSGSDVRRFQLQISGMTCAACSARIEKVVGKMDGVHEVAVNLAMGNASITADNEPQLEEQVMKRIEGLGYGAAKMRESAKLQDESRSLKWKLIVSVLLTIPLVWGMVRHFSFTSGLWIPELFLQPWFQWVLATPVQFVIGQSFYFQAYKAIKNKTATMDVLVVISTTSAYFYSHYMTLHMLRMGESNPHSVYFETGAMIITAVLLGKWLEAAAKKRALKAVAALHQLRPETAVVLRDGESVQIPAAALRAGETVLVQPGEIVPADGLVTEGHSAVDESFLTGESTPVEKGVQHRLIGGSRNRSGTLTMQVRAVGGDSALGRMIRLIEETQGTKPDIARLVDRIASIFVPVVLALALATLACWWLWLSPGDFEGALFKAMAVLVIACPCALGLAAPMSLLVGTGRALEAGILFKDARLVELLHRVDVVVLDKTGTATHGVPRVSDLVCEDGRAQSLLRLAASAEQSSEHPFAQAILAEAHKRKLSLQDAQDYQAAVGRGVSARIGRDRIRVGSKRFLQEQGIPTQAYAKACEQLEAQGKTVLHVASNERHAGLIALGDTLKPTTPQAVRRLKRLRLQVVLLSGDQGKAAGTIASQAGIADYHAEMMPEDKVRFIRRLQQRGLRVCMVGDGVNDAPALAAADVGMAIGTGAAIAKESADINLLRSDLNSVADAVTLSRSTMRNMKLNLAFALVYNVLAIPLAFMGWMAPWIAGTAMALSSLSVVANALRLQRISLRP